MPVYYYRKCPLILKKLKRSQLENLMEKRGWREGFRGEIANYELVAKPELEHGFPIHGSLHLPGSPLDRQGDKSNPTWEARSK